MKITYDAIADAAYIYLADIEAGGVARTYPCDPSEAGAMINLDFDPNERLVGIEVLGASHHLPTELLASAERLDQKR
jgi:uncharacterized protein YuzE